VIQADIAIIGAGAAGLAAAIFAAERARETGGDVRIILLDGAKKPGAKILVSGGGRCNVTNTRVTENDFFGGPRTIIRKVLRAFDEERTRAWFLSLGVELKLEPTGKYFPVSDEARSVLDGLIGRVWDLGIKTEFGARVVAIHREENGFRIDRPDHDPIHARRIILAVGGEALPKSGSDGWGVRAMRSLGHTIIHTTPALAPLILKNDKTPGGRFAEFSGVTLDARLTLVAASGKKLAEVEGSLLFTHFGVSGPAALDISRHWLRAKLEHPDEKFRLLLGLPMFRDAHAADEWLLNHGKRHPRQKPFTVFAEVFPKRIAEAFTEGFPEFSYLSRDQRLELARRLAELELPIIGDRGYSFAEATAGGVDLREVETPTMESRVVPGLHLCGEVLDVDGRIGGFNFQWAWSSGYLAGRGAADAVAQLVDRA